MDTKNTTKGANEMKIKVLGKFWNQKSGRFMVLVSAFGLVYLLPANLAA